MRIKNVAIQQAPSQAITFQAQENLSLLPKQDSLQSKSLLNTSSRGINQKSLFLETKLNQDSLTVNPSALLATNNASSLYNSGTNSLATKLEDLFLLKQISSYSAGTPGSEVLFARSTNRYQILQGRNGEDTLIAFDPVNTTSNDFVFHILIGDQQESNPTNSSDTFVLGDWQRAYYNDGKTSINGVKQIAQIADFQLPLDKIQLHGSSEQYYLQEIPPTDEDAGGTYLFQITEGGLDLIAIITGVFGLNINGDYFQYEGTTAPSLSTGELAQIQHLGSNALDYVSDIAWSGTLLVAGFSSGDLGLATTPRSIPGNADGFVANYSSDGNLLGVQQFGSNNFKFDTITSIDTDNQGNLYIAGSTDGNVGGRNASNPGVEDVFVAKYSSSGQLQWVEQFGTTGTDAPFAVDVDPEGNFLYLTGLEVIYGGENGPIDDAWVAKYDASNGEQVWFNKFGTQAFDEGYGIGVDSQGKVFAAGFTQGNLGGTNAGAYDIWLSQFDANGTQVKTTQFGGSQHEFTWELKLDSQDNIYITGWTESDLGGTLNGAADYFIAKYDNNLNQVWVKQFGSSGYDGTYGLYIDANDDLYVAGYTNGTLEGANAGDYDAFAAKFDSDGNQLWTQQFGTDKEDQGGRITGDNLGNVYITGGTQGSFGDLNGGSVDTWVAKLNGTDGAILNFNPEI